MRSTLMLCPTRGRPDNAVEVLETFLATKTLKGSALVFVVDENDPLLEEYEAKLPAEYLEINESIGSMVTALNSAAILHASIGIYDYLGFIGDDHRLRTIGWDEKFVKGLELVGGGFAYGNDLLQGENLPTHILMNTSIVGSLGWMGLPTCRHLYLDDTWKFIGQELDRLFYFPDIIVEHLHPYANKAAMDAQYEFVNSRAMDAHDHAAYDEWVANRSAADIARIRDVLR